MRSVRTTLFIALLPLLLLLTVFLTVSSSLATSQAQPATPTLTAYMERFEADREPTHDLQPLAAIPCGPDGMADIYFCNNVDLLAFMPLNTIGGGQGNDIWGWTDPLTGVEYAIMGRTTGTAFVDISDPVNPVYVGNLPTQSSSSSWRDIKVYADHAFIVSEAFNHGMQVFDLTRLRGVVSPPATFSADAVYNHNNFGRAHNVVINEDSGYAYIVGADCSGGLHMVDISTPTAPVFAGCFSSDGYTHDAQCVIYNGPDTAHQGDEICFNANEDTLTIVDVTTKAAPAQLSRTSYSGASYTHQVWTTPDHRYLLLGDETDELNFGYNTRTFIWDIADLDVPVLMGWYDGSTTAIDHNLYINDGYAYESNYRAGLQIIDISDIANANLSEAGYFDIYPTSNSASFNGTWSNYPYFDSGVVVVSGIEQGLFILQPTLEPDFTVGVTDAQLAVCNDGGDAMTTVNLGDINGYNTAVTLSTTGLPSGATAAFTPNPVVVPGASDLTVSATGTPPGLYPFDVVGDDGQQSHATSMGLLVTEANLAAPALQNPANGATNQPLQFTFIWAAVTGSTHYEIEIATDAAFNNVVVHNSNLLSPRYVQTTDFDQGTSYYWRVRAINSCDTGSWSPTYTFKTTGTAAVSITPPLSLRSGLPETTATHTFMVTNDGPTTDTFTLAVSGNTWPVSYSADTGPITAGASVAIDIDVAIPAFTPLGATPVVLGTDTFTLTATSQISPTVTAQAAGSTDAISDPSVDLTADPDTQSILAGQSADYTLTLTNTGDYTDTFAIALGSSNWTTSVDASSVGPLAPGATATLTVSVTVDGGGDSDAVVVTAISGLNAPVSASVTLITYAIRPAVIVTSPLTSQTGQPGETVTYTVNVANSGNVTDTFALSLGGNNWASVLSQSSTGALGAGASIAVDVVVTVGTEISDSVIVAATSAFSAEVTGAITLTSLSVTPGVALTADPDTLSGVTGQTVTYTVRITNTGDISDTFSVQMSGNVWPTQLSTMSVGMLAPGAADNLLVTVTIGAGSADTVLITATSSFGSTYAATLPLTTRTNLSFLPILVEP